MSSVKKDKFGGYQKLIQFKVWGKSVKVVFCDDLGKYFKSRYPESSVDMTDTGAATLVGKPDNGHRMVLFKTEDIYKPYKIAGTIAHESWHVIRGILNHAGAELDNEVVAYHIGELVEQITRFADKIKTAESTAPMALNRKAFKPKG